MEWAENVVTSAVAKYGLAHGKAIETGSFDHVIIDPVKIREFYREQREKLPYTEDVIGEKVIKRYDELDLQILKTGLDEDIKTGNQFKKDMGKVFGDI